MENQPLADRLTILISTNDSIQRCSDVFFQLCKDEATARSLFQTVSSSLEEYIEISGNFDPQILFSRLSGYLYFIHNLLKKESISAMIQPVLSDGQTIENIIELALTRCERRLCTVIEDLAKIWKEEKLLPEKAIDYISKLISKKFYRIKLCKDKELSEKFTKLKVDGFNIGLYNILAKVKKGNPKVFKAIKQHMNKLGKFYETWMSYKKKKEESPQQEQSQRINQNEDQSVSMGENSEDMEEELKLPELEAETLVTIGECAVEGNSQQKFSFEEHEKCISCIREGQKGRARMQDKILIKVRPPQPSAYVLLENQN